MLNLARHDFSIYDYVSQTGENKKREGKGRQNFPSLSAFYDGYFYQNKANGRGVLNFEDFVVYEGISDKANFRRINSKKEKYL